MIDFILRFSTSLVNLTNDMSFWLLIGFLIAGILNVVVKADLITRFMGKNNFRSVFNAAMLGVPLPLCSCGVIPTGVAFHKNGASKGAAVSFLISTPQTGVDSIMVTYSLLGLPFALIRPIIALVTGIAGGLLTNYVFIDDTENIEVNENNSSKNIEVKENVIIRIFRYAFIDFMEDIAKWLIIGLLIAALIQVIIPDDYFSGLIGNSFLEMLIILVASIPLYVCATGSVPIAAVLLLKGISPGAALVFLMAGPATNAATITVIGKTMGRKTLISYLSSIIAGALIFGSIINYLLPDSLFIIPLSNHEGHSMHFIPEWLTYSSSIILGVLLLISIYRKNIKPMLFKPKSMDKSDEFSVVVEIGGMSCNMCKANVENAISSIKGIEKFEVDLSAKSLSIKGENIDLEEIKKKVEERGYNYLGKIK